LRPVVFVLIVVGLLGLMGCGGPIAKKTLPSGKVLLTVDFTEGQALEYKFVCSRDITIDWDPNRTSPRSAARAKSHSSETLEMVVVYTPVKVDPFGLTTVQATCKSVRVTRSGRSLAPVRTKDAVEYAAGKSFRIKVGPTGRIEDYSELDALIKELGQKAFRPNTQRGRIKEPDMIGDFVVTQWFLWDSVSSLEPSPEGVKVGQSWGSKLLVPAPMVMRKARDVRYELAEIRASSNGRVALIKSTHRLADSVPAGWPIPYAGRFQMAGTFGFLSGYKVLELEGTGEELFNVDRGRIDQYEHHYRMEVQAFIPLGIRARPRISIDQRIRMELIRVIEANR